MNPFSISNFPVVTQTITAAVVIILTSCGDDPEPQVAPQVTAISPSSGPANTAVTITGTNFSAVISENKVTFNGKEAIVTLATPTQLTATVPISAGPGPVNVIVKGLAAANQPVFMVTAPAAEVTTISPASGPFHTAVTITGTGFSTIFGETKVTFNGKEAVLTQATTTQLMVTVPPAAATGPIVVTVNGQPTANQPLFTVVSIPVLTTSGVNTVTPVTAEGGGNVTSDGGAPITSRGICWSTNPSPTIADNKTSDGTGTGAFSSSITGLAEGTVYYARAYATNSVGTAYGNDTTFTALVIGQPYQGAFIAYIFQPGDPGYCAEEAHGLLVLARFIPFPWERDYNQLIGTKTALGAGRENTNLIVANQAHPVGLRFTAAQVCFSLGAGSDHVWYLPSKDELNKIYINRDKFPHLTKDGRNYYWTSSEASLSDAWIQSFVTGVQSTYDKKGSFHVLPVRYF